MLKLATTALLFLAISFSAQAQNVEEHYKYLHQKCGPSLKMEKSECDCIIKAAKAELSPQELELVVMYVKRDKPGIKRLQGELTGNQTLKAKDFTGNTPNKCRKKT